jgi:hypothetical protein
MVMVMVSELRRSSVIVSELYRSSVIVSELRRAGPLQLAHDHLRDRGTGTGG